MRTKTPVGLKPGDVFETNWGDVEIIEKDGNEYKIKDLETEEVTWTDHDILVRAMVATVYS